MLLIPNPGHLHNGMIALLRIFMTRPPGSVRVRVDGTSLPRAEARVLELYEIEQTQQTHQPSLSHLLRAPMSGSLPNKIWRKSAALEPNG